MKAKCPNCKTDLRYVQSIKSLLCNDCGFSLAVEDEPKTTPKPKPVNPVFKKHKPWDFSLHRFIFLGFSVLAIAVIAQGISAINQYQTSKKIDAAIADSQKLIKEIKASQINIKDLPSVCQPRDYIHLTYKMFEECFIDGITHDQVFAMVGSPGRLVSESGSLSIYQWRGTESIVTLSFQDSRLIGKNQINLHSDPMGED